MIFGIPKKRRSVAKVEKYDFPVIDIQRPNDEANRSSVIYVNPAARELLGFDFEGDVKQKICFAFDEGATYVLNATGRADISEDAQYGIYKNGNVANKKLHTYLMGREELGVGEFALQPATDGMFLLTTLPETTSSPVDTVAENEEEISAPAEASSWS